MTESEKGLIRVIAFMLQSPRNRYGKIETDRFLQSKMKERAEAMGLFNKLPHGGVDGADQAAMILMALIGDLVRPMNWPT